MSFNRDELAKKIKDDNFIFDVAKRYFDSYDKNSSGYIEIKELARIMSDMSKTFFNCTPEKGMIEAQFGKLDKDKNNKVDFIEFKNFIKEFLQNMIEYF